MFFQHRLAQRIHPPRYAYQIVLTRQGENRIYKVVTHILFTQMHLDPVSKERKQVFGASIRIKSAPEHPRVVKLGDKIEERRGR